MTFLTQSGHSQRCPEFQIAAVAAVLRPALIC